MNKDEASKKYFKLLAGIGFCLNMIDDLRDTPLYRGDLKRKLNLAYKQLEAEEKIFSNPGDLDDKTAIDMWQQMQDSYTFFETWLNTAFEIPIKRHEKFTRYVQIGVEQYK